MHINNEDSLQDISVELQLAVPQKLSNHLPAQAFPLQQEVGHSDGRVRDEAACDQEVDASLWVPARKKKRRRCEVLNSACVMFLCFQAERCVGLSEKKNA